MKTICLDVWLWISTIEKYTTWLPIYTKQSACFCADLAGYVRSRSSVGNSPGFKTLSDMALWADSSSGSACLKAPSQFRGQRSFFSATTETKACPLEHGVGLSGWMQAQ